jgi:ribonuclease BN (tRNA processing enzyme)
MGVLKTKRSAAAVSIAALLSLASLQAVAARRSEARHDIWITLGTQGGPQPSAKRSQPANLLLRNGNAILVDAGDGVSGRLAAAGIAIQSVHMIFLSHLHFDHTGGLMGLLALNCATSAQGQFSIYGPPGTREMVEGMIAAMRPAVTAGYGAKSSPPCSPSEMLRVTELRTGAEIRLGDIVVRAVENSHYGTYAHAAQESRPISLSFRFDTPDRSVVYTGDTGPSEAVTQLARGADILVSEVIDLDPTVNQIKRQAPTLSPGALAAVVDHLRAHHLTPQQVGVLARTAKVKHVILTHQLPGGTDAGSIAALRRGVAKEFDGAVLVAADLDRY